MYTLEFAPDGRALTAIVSLSSPPVPPAQPNAPQPAQVARDYVFEWNVTSPRSITRIAIFGRSVATSPGGNSSLPLLAPDGRTLAAGAPFSSFGVTLWTLP